MALTGLENGLPLNLEIDDDFYTLTLNFGNIEFHSKVLFKQCKSNVEFYNYVLSELLNNTYFHDRAYKFKLEQKCYGEN